MDMPGLEPVVSTKLDQFIRGSYAMARRVSLLESRLARTQSATNARNARKKQSAKVLQSGGVLYAKEARGMTRDRQNLENLRQRERIERSDKRVLNQIKKVHKATIKHRKTWYGKRTKVQRIMKRVMKEL